MVLLWIGSALALPGYASDHGRIAAAVDAGEIAPVDGLYLRFVAHFDPEALPNAYYAEHVDHWACGTGVVMELKQSYHLLSDAQREHVDRTLVPWGGTLLEPFPVSQEPPPPLPEDYSCFGSNVNGTSTVHGDNFVVHYETGVSKAIAEQFLDDLEEGREPLIEAGWTPVYGTHRFPIMAYIQNGSGSGAYTTVAECGTVGWMPYIVTYESVFSDATWAESMAPHEYHHAQQFTYGSGHEFWYWEATATWIEEIAQPSANQWSSYLYGGYSLQPWIAMRASSQQDQNEFYHMYGMGVWGFHITENVGENVMLDTWKYAKTHGSQYDLSIVDVLNDLGHDFDAIYADFVARNTVFDYNEGRWMGDVAIERTHGSLPADGESTRSHEPEALGQNYIEISPGAATDDAPDLRVSFTGESSSPWLALLVGTDGSDVAGVAEVTVADDGTGTGVLQDFGAFDQVFLVVSPTHLNSSRSFSYSYALEGTSFDGPEPGDSNYLDSGDPEIPGIVLDDPLLSCGAVGAVPGALGVAAGVLLLGWRRRQD